VNDALREIARAFRLGGEPESAEPVGSGHINETQAVTVRTGDGPRRFVLQRLNERVFPDPLAVMENVRRVTEHLAEKHRAAGRPDVERHVLTLVPTADGGTWHEADDGSIWRAYPFVERARAVDVVDSPALAREAARAFGAFTRDLADLPGERLHETIPSFHDTRARLAALTAAVAADAAGRAADVGPEIEFAEKRRGTASLLEDARASGLVPERIVHNDTKINNVLLDPETGEGVCVIDRDPVLPGLSLHDLGAFVRTSVSPAAQDERDLAKVAVRKGQFAQSVDLVGISLDTSEVGTTALEQRILPTTSFPTQWFGHKVKVEGETISMMAVGSGAGPSRRISAQAMSRSPMPGRVGGKFFRSIRPGMETLRTRVLLPSRVIFIW